MVGGVHVCADRKRFSRASAQHSQRRDSRRLVATIPRSWFLIQFFRMKRQFDPAEPELMDRPQPVSAELERDLKNLRQLNRWFGSHRIVRHFVRRWIKPGHNMRIVDLATGSGDIPRLIVDLAGKMGANVEVDALDRQSATLEIARGLSGDYPEISFLEGNTLQFDPPDRYDI